MFDLQVISLLMGSIINETQLIELRILVQQICRIT